MMSRIHAIYLWAVILSSNSCWSKDLHSDQSSNVGSKFKRSSGLLHDMFDIAVKQKFETVKLRKEAQEVRQVCIDVLSKLEDKNSQVNDIKLERQKYLKEIRASKDVIKKMQKELKDQRLNLAELKSEQKKIKNEGSERKKMMNNLKINDLKLKNEMTKFKAELKTMDNENHVKIAFTAQVNEMKTVASGSVIPYKSIHTNIGGGYNATDCIFYCPRQGLYMISASLEIHTQRVVSQIFKNGKSIGIFIKGSSSNVWDMSSVTVAIYLNKGDKVWVQNNDKAYISGISMFTGILISK